MTPHPFLSRRSRSAARLRIPVLCRTLVCGALLFAGLTGTAQAQPKGMSQGEIALLPDFCADRLNYPVYNWTHPRWAYWRSRMGDSFMHVHHYCWALVSMRRASTTADKQQRRYLNETAINDLEYVIKNTPPNFKLLPEIYTKIGAAAYLVGEIGAAYDAYLMARNLKPDYWPAYAEWAEVLIKSGQKASARDLLKQGLARAPGTKALEALYRQLGEDPALVAPMAPAASAVAPSPEGASAPQGATPASAP